MERVYEQESSFLVKAACVSQCWVLSCAVKEVLHTPSINQSFTPNTHPTTLQELGYYRQLGKLVRAVAAGGCYTPLTGAQHTI